MDLLNKIGNFFKAVWEFLLKIFNFFNDYSMAILSVVALFISLGIFLYLIKGIRTIREHDHILHCQAEEENRVYYENMDFGGSSENETALFQEISQDISIVKEGDVEIDEL